MPRKFKVFIGLVGSISCDKRWFESGIGRLFSLYVVTKISTTPSVQCALCAVCSPHTVRETMQRSTFEENV